MLNKDKRNYFGILAEFFKLLGRNPRAIKRYLNSGAKSKYSFRDIESSGILFIHIPKCAGVSVNNALYGSLGVGHVSLGDALLALGPKQFSDVFKFSIVRNPWARLVSAYFFLKKGGFGERDRNFFDEHLSCYKDFDEFVRLWLTQKNSMVWNHFIPQHFFLSASNSRVCLDYLCFLESLEDDFEEIYKSKKWEAFKSLAMENPSSHNDYKSYYTEETRDIVTSVYEQDIVLLGYTFEGGNLVEQRSWRDKEFPLE